MPLYVSIVIRESGISSEGIELWKNEPALSVSTLGGRITVRSDLHFAKQPLDIMRSSLHVGHL